MSVYRVTEVIGVSDESWEAAARSAVETAAGTVRELRIAEVVPKRARRRCEIPATPPSDATGGQQPRRSVAGRQQCDRLAENH